MKLKVCIIASVVLLGVLVGAAVASHHGKSKEKKIGILLVAFGSSEESAQISFENIEKNVKASYPDIPVRWAFTSHIIRKKLAGRGKLYDSPEVALAKMLDEGFTNIAVQSLHTIAGAEYNDYTKSSSHFK